MQGKSKIKRLYKPLLAAGVTFKETRVDTQTWASDLCEGI